MKMGMEQKRQPTRTQTSTLLLVSGVKMFTKTKSTSINATLKTALQRRNQTSVG